MKLIKLPAGRPRVLKDGKNVNVYLDSKTLAKALKLGNGSVSAGIRFAVNTAST